jgi:hypothetical protein
MRNAIAEVCGTTVRTADTGKEQVARGNLLQILTRSRPVDGGRRDNASKSPYST